MRLSNKVIFNEIANDYNLSSTEEITDLSELNLFYMNELKRNIDINIDVSDVSQEATALLLLEAVNLSAKEIDSRFYDDKIVIANYIFAHCTNIYWYRDESWGFDCYYFWFQSYQSKQINPDLAITPADISAVPNCFNRINPDRSIPTLTGLPL